MKVLTIDNVVENYGTHAALCGIRLQSVTLSGKDFQELLRANPEQLRMWVELLSMRFNLTNE